MPWSGECYWVVMLTGNILCIHSQWSNYNREPDCSMESHHDRRDQRLRALTAVPTVKPLIFACLLFCKFGGWNKTAKANSGNVYTIPSLMGIVCCIGIMSLEFTKTKGAKIILHVKSPTLLWRIDFYLNWLTYCKVVQNLISCY